MTTQVLFTSFCHKCDPKQKRVAECYAIDGKMICWICHEEG